MLVEKAPIRALTRSRVGKTAVSMPWASSSRHIQTSCTAISVNSRQARQTSPITSTASSRSRKGAIRLASTTTNDPNSPPLNANSSASSLTWDQFLQLRKVRRRYNLVTSVFAGGTTTTMGAAYLSTQDLNQISSILFGVDPMIGLGVSTLACGAFGWLVGPFAGNFIFNLSHSKVKNDIIVKERDFFHRIRRHRADITAGGNLQNNPFPDYYGEKIDSVKGYRQWLRDQRKFSKKRQYQGV